VGWDEGRAYRLDALAAPELLGHRVRGADLRGLLIGLKTWEEAPEEVTARLWLGGGEAEELLPQAEAQRLLAAGFEEIAEFFRDKGGSRVAAYLG